MNRNCFLGWYIEWSSQRLYFLFLCQGKLCLQGQRWLGTFFFSYLPSLVNGALNVEVVLFVMIGERWHIYGLWEHISCSYRVQEGSAMVWHDFSRFFLLQKCILNLLLDEVCEHGGFNRWHILYFLVADIFLEMAWMLLRGGKLKLLQPDLQ